MDGNWNGDFHADSDPTNFGGDILNLEERKAIAKRVGQDWDNPDYFSACEKFYPKCCSYHDGFDDALSLLTSVSCEDYYHAQCECWNEHHLYAVPRETK